MTSGNNSIPADAPLNAKGREELGLPPRMTLREELNLIGCHSNGDARCTCVVAQDAIAEIDRLRDYMLETSGRLHQLASDTNGLSPRDMRELANDMCRIANLRHDP